MFEFLFSAPFKKTKQFSDVAQGFVGRGLVGAYILTCGKLEITTCALNLTKKDLHDFIGMSECAPFRVLSGFNANPYLASE